MRCAVSGLRHGRVYLDIFRERDDCELVGVFDPNMEHARQCIADDAQATAHTSFEEMLEKDRPDIVAVSSPEFAHADQTVKALEAGAHVICEKAMADTAEGLERMIAAVERTGRLCYVGQEVRFTPAFLDARRLLQDGRLGTVYQAESCYIHNCEYLCINGQWRGNPDLAADAMIGGGCHPVDLLRSLFGEVDEVFARHTHANPDPTPYPDCTTALLRFEQGTVATVVVSIATRRPYRLKLNLNGTKAYFKGDNSGASSALWSASPGRHAEEALTIQSHHASHDIGSQVQNLIDGIDKGAPLVVDAWEGANAVAICLAAVTSAETGQPVKPRRFERPGGVPAPAEPLDFMQWRTAEEILDAGRHT